MVLNPKTTKCEHAHSSKPGVGLEEEIIDLEELDMETLDDLAEFLA